METAFRPWLTTLIGALPASNAKFSKFNTNPFVLMAYSRQKSYRSVAEIERDLVPAKVFSSMETSAGKMVEKVVLPVYGWEIVASAMQTYNSLLDGRMIASPAGKLVCVTLKSGPSTLNDGTAKDIGEGLVRHASAWAVSSGAQHIDFTYGVLYGTKRQSNKKDWHILRHIDDARRRPSHLNTSHHGGWEISYSDGPLTVSATIRIGIEWWEYLGGPDAWLELCCALIRACIAPSTSVPSGSTYVISDLAEILDLTRLDSSYNVSILQRSQFEWLLFLARHFCDGFVPDA